MREPTSINDVPETMSLGTVLLLLLCVIGGAAFAVAALPAWLPGLTGTLAGTEPKAYWYLSRASALVAYALVWLSMMFGVALTNKMARLWPGGPAAYDLHEHTSLLGLAFGLFHALILLGDHYINYTLAQVLVPFASTGYKPLAVGVGQVGFYLLAFVGLSFYARKLIGQTGWRLIHFLSFATFGMTLLHAVYGGTDTPALSNFYWFTAGALLFMIVYRLLTPFIQEPARRPA